MRIDQVDYSNFVIVLARQRSGTHALRSVLETHPEILCFPEILYTHPVTKRGVAPNFLWFVERKTGTPASEAITVDNHEELFLAYLDCLRLVHDKRLKVLDVKYNHALGVFAPTGDELALFSLLRRHKLPVLNLTRRNYLRYHLSSVKAKQSRVYLEIGVGTSSDDQRVEVDTKSLMGRLQQCSAESERIARSFEGYDRYFTIDYDDLFTYLGGPISERVLLEIAQWLGIPPEFPRQTPHFKKQGILPLEETIMNFKEVEAALRGTPFEYCLDDEWFYRSEPAAG
jgi:hypothetical protein